MRGGNREAARERTRAGQMPQPASPASLLWYFGLTLSPARRPKSNRSSKERKAPAEGPSQVNWAYRDCSLSGSKRNTREDYTRKNPDTMISSPSSSTSLRPLNSSLSPPLSTPPSTNNKHYAPRTTSAPSKASAPPSKPPIPHPPALQARPSSSFPSS